MEKEAKGNATKPEVEQISQWLLQHVVEGVALHELVFDEANNPVNYRILAVNMQYQRDTGLAPDSVVGKLATEAYGTKLPPYFAEFTQVALGGRPRHFETFFEPHGRFYEISVAPMGQGCFATIFKDISDRRKQEEALRIRTDEMDQFFRLSIDLLCIGTTEGRFLRVNAAWADVLGWSVQELEGKSFLDLVHPDDLLATNEALRALSQGRTVTNFTNRYRARDGSYHSIEWRSAPGSDGRIYAAARDVTRRLAHEQALRTGEERFRRIFELVPNLMTLVATDGVLLDCNEAFCKTTGYAREEAVGRKLGDIGLWEDLRQPQAILQTLAKGDEVHDLEVNIHSKNGQLRVMLLSSRMLELGGQEVAILVARDITDQRNLEQQVLHSQKLESLGVLAGGIAHDFNNLLTGVLGNADLALRTLPPTTPAGNYLDAIGSAARRAAELCRQLLAYSGKGRFLVQPIDLAQTIQEMGHLLAVSITKMVVLNYQFSQAIPAILADATQIRQVIMNLIVNASEAIGDRSGVISVSTGLAHVDGAYLKGYLCAEDIRPGDFVYLEVADTGQGMDRATLDRIFDPFFTTKFTGRGLGLAAVLGIVRGHRGAIRVTSEPSRGTTFKLLFPASESSVVKVDKIQESTTWQSHGWVMIVDDEETVRNLGRRMLERIGFSVLTAVDGREALDRFSQETNPIRLVVLDLTMPEIDGEACFRALRQIQPGIKVILTSGYNEQEVVNLFAGRGLAGFLQKPFTYQDLVTKVREVLGEG